MMADARYSMRDLIAAALQTEGISVSERLVQQYLAEGLLPPSAGPAGTFGTEHLLRLRLVLRLTSQYVGVKDVRPRLARLTDSQIQALLGRPAIPRSPSEGSAVEYLDRVFADLPPPSTTPAMSRPAALPDGRVRKAPAATPHADPERAAPVHSDWVRITVAPDVELFVRARSGTAWHRTVDRLVDAVQMVLADANKG